MTDSQEVSQRQPPYSDTHPLILAQSKEEVGRIDSDTLNKEATETVTSDVDRKNLARKKLLTKEN